LDDFPTANAFHIEIGGHQKQIESAETSAANAADKKTFHRNNVDPGLFWAMDPHDTFDRRRYHSVEDIRGLLLSPNARDVERGHKKEMSNEKLAASMAEERLGWDYTK
jgi:hypothetical protein